MAKTSARNKGKTEFVQELLGKKGLAVTGVELRARSSGRHGSLEEVEADIDRLLFKVMGVGGLPAIEESLRQTRRLLYGAFAGK